MAYFGIGPLFDYSDFDVIIQSQHFHMEQATLGLSAVLGYGYRIGHAIARIEGKYFYERATYIGLQFGLQGAF